MSLFRGGQDPANLPSSILQSSTARICTQANGTAWSAVRAAPVRVLAHVLGNYLALLGQEAVSRAEAGGRTSVSFADAAGALESVGLAPDTLLELVYQLKADAPRAEAETSRATALHNSGHLLKNMLADRREGRMLSYGLFSEEELAALDRAAESEVEEDVKPVIPSPLSSSGSSDDSDAESSRMLIDKPKSPVQRRKRKASVLEELPESEELIAVDRWRDPSVIPDYIPPFLPPLPGLAKGDRIEDDEADRSAHPLARQPAKLFNSGELWRSTIPFERSKLAELPHATSVPQITEPPDLDLQEEGSMTAFNKLQQRFTDVPRQPEHLVPTDKRRRVASLLLSHRFDPHDTLSGAVPPDPYRQSSRSAGWVPYAFDQLGRPSVYLRDFDGPSIDALSTPATNQPATFAPPAGRSPSILSHLTRQLGLQNPTMASRLLRLGPPGPVDESGNTIPYLLDDTGAKLAVQLPPHQNPLYFVPGWFWKTRDPLDETLPNVVKPAPPLTSIEPPPPETALEPPIAALGEEAASDAPVAPEVFASDDLPPAIEAEAAAPLPVKEQTPVPEPAARAPELETNGFRTPLEGTPVPSHASGSVPPEEYRPQIERKPSETKIRIKLRTPVTPRETEMTPLNTNVARAASPGGFLATPASAGGTKLKLKLSFGGARRQSESATPGPPATPDASARGTPPAAVRQTPPAQRDLTPIIKQEDEGLPLIPMPPPKQVSPAALPRVTEEEEETPGEPFVAMPPPKPRALMSPVVLQRSVGNGVNGHRSPTPPSAP